MITLSFISPIKMALMKKTILRPVVVKTAYQGPSAECSRDYNEVKREMSYLCSGMNYSSIKKLDAFDRVLLKCKEVRGQVRRALANKIVTPFRSWSGVVRSGFYKPEPMELVEIDPPRPYWSRSDARRDFSRAFKNMQDQCRQARHIVEGMASRRPFIVRSPRTIKVDLVHRFELKAAMKRLRKERRDEVKPKQVDQFSFRCYPAENKCEVPSLKCEEEGMSRGVVATSKKQIKVKRVIYEYDQNCQAIRKESVLTTLERRDIMISQMSKTVAGQLIMMAYLAWKARKMGKDLVDIVPEVLKLSDKISNAFEHDKVEPQMEAEGVVSDAPRQEVKISNTIIDSLNPVDRGDNVQVLEGFKSLAISREHQLFSTMVDRWILLGYIPWETKTLTRSRLTIPFLNNATTMKLPLDILANNLNSPNAQIFMSHRWSRFSIKLRICLNSNPFQVGSLVVSAMYQNQHEDDEPWDNIYSAMQRNHVKLNAGSSNDAELLIPYRNVHSMSNVTEKETIATVCFYVLNQLVVTPSVAAQCTLSVYATFEDVEFTGLISHRLGAIPQMDSVANVMNAGSSLIRTIRGDRNRDNPPIALQPMAFVPQAMPSFAYTDGVGDPVNVLRADSRGQTPHGDLSDEMNPNRIMRIWGYLKTIQWSTSYNYGHILANLPAIPLGPGNQYSATVNLDNIKSVVYPPLAYVTSMFGRWRGDLEYKFEIFGSKYHTGRLMIGSIPFISENLAVTIEDLKNSAYKVCDLADSTEFIVRVPWQWRDPSVEVYLEDVASTPSRLFVAIANPLIAIDSVAPLVYINVYIRAAENYEVMILRPSVLAPRFSDRLQPPSSEYLTLYNTEDKVWTDWRGDLVMTNTNAYATTPNIDSVVKGWEGFTNAKLGEYYELADQTTKGYMFRLQTYAGSKLVDVKWACYDPALSTNVAHGLVICSKESDAIAFAKAALSPSPDWPSLRQKYCYAWVKQGPASELSSDRGVTWFAARNTPGNSPVWKIRKLVSTLSRRGNDYSDEEYERIEAQIGEAQVDMLETPTPTTQMGLKIFGEASLDLKSICRRFIHFGTIEAKSCIMGNPRDCPYTASFAVVPVRHVDPKTSHSFDNRWRNGVISNVAAMYKLWRGGLRYRFVVVGNPPEGTTLYIQHRYDMFMTTDEIIVSGKGKVITRDDLMNTQYATFAQALDVNSTCTVEVPYYSTRENLSVMKQQKHAYGSEFVTDNSVAHNGVVLLWIHSKVEANIHLEVFYSLADDCRFSVFQGTPVTMDLNEINAEPQMEKEAVLVEQPKSQGIFQSIKAALKIPTKTIEMTDTVANTAKSLEETSNKFSSLIDSLKTTKDKFNFANIKQKARGMAAHSILDLLSEELSEMGSKVFDVATHLIYAILAPSAKVIAWALFNIYKQIFGLSFGGVQALTTYISQLWERMTSPTQRPQEETAEPQGEDPLIGSYASLLFTSIATLCKLKVNPPSDWKSVSDGLFSLSLNARGGMFVGKFVEDNVELFKRTYYKFVGLFGSSTPNFNLIAGIKDKRLNTWLLASDIVLSTQYQDRVMTEPSWAQKVFELSVVGRAFERVLMMDLTMPARLLQTVKTTSMALRKLEQKLISRKVFSGVRYTPSCTWLGGTAGTGKTYFMQELAEEMAILHKYTGMQTYHTMTAGVKYFDAYDGQPMIIMDDFLASPIVGGSVDIGVQYLQLKSCNAFNMPKSAVEDKDQLLNFADLGITSNKMFVDNIPGITEYDAYNRRRDVLLRFDFVKGVTADNVKSRYTRQQMKDMAHLNVFSYESPSDKGNIEGTPLKIEGTVRNSVMKYVVSKLAVYHEREALDYEDRCRTLQKRLAAMGSDDTFDAVYKQYAKGLEKFDSNISENCFDIWLQDTAKAASVDIGKIDGNDTQDPGTSAAGGKQRVEPQGPHSEISHVPVYIEKRKKGVNPFRWPSIIDDRCNPIIMSEYPDDDPVVKDKAIIEPFQRPFGKFRVQLKHDFCHHDYFDFESANYDEKLDVFYSDRMIQPHDDSRLVYSVPAGPCWHYNEQGELEEVPDCAWTVDPAKFMWQYLGSPSVRSIVYQKIDLCKRQKSWKYIDDEPELIQDFVKSKFTCFDEPERTNKRLQHMIDKEQQILRGKFDTIGPIYVPKREPPAFCGGCFSGSWWKNLLGVLYGLSCLITIIWGVTGIISLIASLFYGFIDQTYRTFEAVARPFAKNTPQMHPSGDYKTIRNAKTVRARAVRLMDGQGPEVSTTNDVIKECSYARNNGGIYRKIINNSFFLVGKIPIEGTENFMIYKARCLGLYNKKFLVLKHYIEHFQNVGVKRVVMVYHDNQGMIEYDLADIEFRWTSEGYGVGDLPKSAPRQFADITKYMPSESFDMTYPRQVKIFEIWNEQVIEHQVEATLLSQPIDVTGTATEGSWTINQGFQYAWGGRGRCGSILIAEGMACPLIGIHTAGVGQKRGYAELLFKNTFVESTETILEYVVPNMQTSEATFGLDGSYYQVGTLDSDMAVRGSTKTRIRESEIHGVFDVKTEPAPLIASDPRLSEPLDILKIGASKRCDPPKEFPRDLVRSAFLSYNKLIQDKVKPIRANPGVLTAIQAIEGFPLPGYEGIEMTTSEGYPWVTMRPANETNKSWLFQLDKYPDGRMKVMGFNPDLASILTLKSEMRDKGVVPCSYFTCCLKDARILREKVSIPGKTRVFEACPVDLTISYRQYFLDYIAAFSAARLEAENSIGINPDGAEWTQLVNWLTEFSPFIITADYGAFGPRQIHAFLENSFNVAIEWSEENEVAPEDEKNRRYLVREGFREEIVHAPTIVKNTVFYPSCGMPSGFPATVVKNSSTNCMYIRAAFMALARKYCKMYADIFWFEILVRLVTNGDDLIAAVHPDIIAWFNNETLIEFFAEYNIKMTDALKSGKVRPHCTIEEATYLKRGFKQHPTRKGQWMAPLEEASVTDTANWIWRCVDVRGASLVNSEMCCRLAYSSGPDFYEQIASTLQQRWKQEGVTFVYPPWILLDNHVWDQAPGPLFSF